MVTKRETKEIRPEDAETKANEELDARAAEIAGGGFGGPVTVGTGEEIKAAIVAGELDVTQ